MPRAPGSVPEHSQPLYDAFLADLEASGRERALSARAARRFLVRFPDLRAFAELPLERRLRIDGHARPFLLFLMLHRHLRPGYDFLLRRKMPSVWREIVRSPLRADLDRFLSAAAQLGFSRRNALGVGSQVIVRVLIQSGKELCALEEADLDALAVACRDRERQTGVGWVHYERTLFTAHQVLYHLHVLEAPPVSGLSPQSFSRRMAGVPDTVRPSFVAYLECLAGTHTKATITSTATHLSYFG